MRSLAVFLAMLALAAAPSSAAASGAPALPSNDPFYAYSGSLAHVAPGAVLRRRTVSVAEAGKSTAITATQILYRTTDELGTPRATVATVLRPIAHVGATKLVSYQTAYDALGSQCDPSYTLQGGNPSYATSADEEQIILGYVAAGNTVVVPDYEGEQLDWAAGQESGYGTLDGIRATESLLGLPAGTPVGIVGYSGGSIATEFASELAPKYSPQLNIVGAAEGGVPVDFLHNLAYINGSPVWSGVIPAVLDSLGRAFNVSFEQYLSPYGRQVTGQVQHGCINSFLGNYPGLTYQKLLSPRHQDIFRIPAVVKIADRLIMSRTGTPKGPLFIGVGEADGIGDGVMVAKDVEALAHTYCERGVSVQFTQYAGDAHVAAAVPFETGALQFLTERLAGVPVKNGCATIGTGNSLAPLAVPMTPASLKFTYVGPRARALGIVFALSSTSGALHGLLVTLRHRARLVASLRVVRLGTVSRRLVLREHGHIPPAGRYTLKVTQGRRILVTRTLKLR